MGPRGEIDAHHARGGPAHSREQNLRGGRGAPQECPGKASSREAHTPGEAPFFGEAPFSGTATFSGKATLMRKIATIAPDPAAPMFHRFRSDGGEHVLIVPYSRVFDLPFDA